jgi:hypothetical protein
MSMKMAVVAVGIVVAVAMTVALGSIPTCGFAKALEETTKRDPTTAMRRNR